MSPGPGGPFPPAHLEEESPASSSVTHLSPGQLRDALGIRDLSDPAAGPHAIQLLADRAAHALSRTWSCGVRWCRGPDIGVAVDEDGETLGKTLTNEAANSLRDRIYLAVHQGSEHQWAGPAVTSEVSA